MTYYAKPLETHETDINGCHVRVDKLDDNLYHTTVSYKSYDLNGNLFASPTWENIGGEKSTAKFIARTVKQAQPALRSLPELQHGDEIITVEVRDVLDFSPVIGLGGGIFSFLLLAIPAYYVLKYLAIIIVGLFTCIFLGC